MTQKKRDTIKSLAIHDKDVGSTEIQIGLLTDKISNNTEHDCKLHSINGTGQYHIESMHDILGCSGSRVNVSLGNNDCLSLLNIFN